MLIYAVLISFPPVCTTVCPASPYKWAPLVDGAWPAHGQSAPITCCSPPLADPGTAAARALAALGVDLDQAKETLRRADITGTSDEPPEEAGRRQMVIHVTGERLTIEATDPVITEAGRAALHALGDQASPPGTIRGDLSACASLSSAWQALHDSLHSIQRRAALPADSSSPPTSQTSHSPGPVRTRSQAPAGARHRSGPGQAGPGCHAAAATLTSRVMVSASVS